MRAAILLSTACIFTTACSRTGITVGSKNFTEQLILGEIVSQQIERRLHVNVDRKLNLGGTLLAHEALAGGSIDLYPEYTGTAMAAVLKESPQGDQAASFAHLNEVYKQRWKLEWMPPMGFENTFAMVVTGDRARTGGLQALSDAARQADPWRLGAGYEFVQRADGLPGLVKAYGLRVRGDPIIMDLGLLYRSLEGGQTDMVAGNSTDGIIAAHHLTVLTDDKHYFPRYDCGIVVRESALQRMAGLREALAELSGKISDAEMRRLNYAVDGNHRPPREVAAEFLAANERK